MADNTPDTDTPANTDPRAPTEYATPREIIRRVFEQHGVVSADAERDLLKSLTVSLMADGYTFALAGEALGVPESTLRSWQQRDGVFAQALVSVRDFQRRWLLGVLRANLETGGKAASQAANILANLMFPELRQTKVQLSTNNGPQRADSEQALDAILARGKGQ